MTTQVENKVRAGDWIVVVQTSRVAYIGRPDETQTRVDLARVTHATRDGRAVEWEDGRGYRMGARGTVVTLPADRLEWADVAHVARMHTYPDSTIPRPWESLDDLRNDLRPLLKDKGK